MGLISFTTDVWSDPNLTPYMAVTAHWIQSVVEDTPSGPKQQLRLQADLIGFHHIPGHHSGEHLARCFLFVTDRLDITDKVCALMILILVLILVDR